MANLFSAIQLGANTRPFESSGRADRGAHTGRDGTFWNWAGRGGGGGVELPPCTFGPLLNFVGPFAGPSACPAQGWLVTPLPPGFPPDLHLAQVQERAARRRRAAG